MKRSSDHFYATTEPNSGAVKPAENLGWTKVPSNRRAKRSNVDMAKVYIGKLLMEESQLRQKLANVKAELEELKSLLS